MPPRASVLMCAHDNERHLRTAVESVVSQTFREIEFIIVDDASTDGTPGILAEAAARDARIRLATNKSNLGLTRSLNLGLGMSAGEYIVRLDADDEALPERLTKQVAFMDANPTFVAAGCWYEMVDGEGHTIDTVRPPVEPEKVLRAFLWSAPIIHPAAIMRRAAVQKAGGYDAENFPYAQDRDLFLRLSRQGRLGNVPEVLVRYRRIPLSISVEKEETQKRCAMLAVSRAISAGTFPAWRRIHLLRPWISTHLPAPLRRMKNLATRALGLRHAGGG